MEKTSVQKLAKVLKWLVTITFICNILALFIVPSWMHLGRDDLLLFLKNRLLELTVDPALDSEPIPVLLFGGLFVVWNDPVASIYTVFLWVCGCCSAVILWQARRILDTILEANPFQSVNARAMKRAATACWVVFAAALIRFVVETVSLKSLVTLFTYNTLFIVAAFMAGLLFLVMSALFRQATELKEDQDLTI